MGCGAAATAPQRECMSLSMLLSADSITVKLNVHVQRDNCFSKLKKKKKMFKEIKTSCMSDISRLLYNNYHLLSKQINTTDD